MRKETYITTAGVSPNSPGTEILVGQFRGRSDGVTITDNTSAYDFRVPVTPATQRLRLRSRAEWRASTEDFADPQNGGSPLKEKITADYQTYIYG